MASANLIPVQENALAAALMTANHKCGWFGVALASLSVARRKRMR